MPPSDPSLVKIVSDGGILMGPFLLIALVWIVCTVRYILNKHRRLKELVALLLFPLAFVLLTVCHWILYSHTQFKEMEISGYRDITQHIQGGLIMTRSGLVMAASGGISLLVTWLMFMLPCKEENRQDEAAR